MFAFARTTCCSSYKTWYAYNVWWQRCTVNQASHKTSVVGLQRKIHSRTQMRVLQGLYQEECSLLKGILPWTSDNVHCQSSAV